ncbi:MAG: glycosyltransferase [Gemmatimonadota bacterium]|nr:glycosyltransferase [Gemmatimonadota bacterium]
MSRNNGETRQAGREPLRILLLAAADVIHARRWAEYFRMRGHRLAFATLDPSGIEGTGEMLLGSFTGVDAVRYPAALPSLRRLVKNFQPQVVNAHFVPGYGFLASLVPSARPLVVSAWGSDILLGPGKSFLHRWRARHTLGQAGLVTCDGAVLAGLIQELGVPDGRILEVPMGIDPALFHPPLPGTENEKRPGEKNLRIISSRTLEPLYGVETLLRSAAILKEAGWGFECAVLGDGSQRSKLEELSGQLGLEERVEFLGGLTSGGVAEALRSGDIYVSCSYSDSTSVSLLEALATGLFPVVSDIPGNREWISHGRNGLCFNPGDPGALAECLIRAMKDSDLRGNARAENLGTIEKKALWENNMRLVEDRFYDIAATGR